MRERIKSLEQQLLAAQGHANVAKSKIQQAAEGEKFLLETLQAMSDQLKSSCVDTAHELAEESNRIKVRLDSEASTSRPVFAASREKRYILALFQDRVEQLSELFNRSKQTLIRVHQALFPINVPPEGFRGLLTKYRDGRRIHFFVNAQLIGGAQTALAVVLTHYPEIDLQLIKSGPPRMADGSNFPMMAYYQACRSPAKGIVQKMLLETVRRWRAERRDTSDFEAVLESLE